MTISNDSGEVLNSNYYRRYNCINQFVFGVPLEDIFQNGFIHPQLKNLLDIAFESLLSNASPLENILKYDEGDSQQHLIIVDKLEYSRDITYTSTGILLWSIKYFLESLPISVLPKYTNQQHFNWLALGNSCRILMSGNHKESKTCILYDIVDNLMRLPSVNIILFDYLTKFFAAITKINCKTGKLKKSSLILLVKYYGGSFFNNSFHIEDKKENEKYYALLYYMIINLKMINKILSKKSFPKTIIPLNLHKTTFTNKESKNQSTQTIYDNEIIDIPEKTIEEFNSCTSDLSLISSNIVLVETVACQTDLNNVANSNYTNTICSCCQRQICKQTTESTTQYEEIDDNNEHFYTPMKLKPSEITKLETVENPTKQLLNCQGDKTVGHTITDKLHCLQSSTSCITIDNGGEYIYDEYGEQMQLLTTPDRNSFNKREKLGFLNSTPYFSVENSRVCTDSANEELVEKMSKLGWTYTPPRVPSLRAEDSLKGSNVELGETMLSSRSNIGWKNPVPKYYHELCVRNEARDLAEVNFDCKDLMNDNIKQKMGDNDFEVNNDKGDGRKHLTNDNIDRKYLSDVNNDGKYLLDDNIGSKHSFYDNKGSPYFLNDVDNRKQLFDDNIDSKPLFGVNIDSKHLLGVNIDSKHLVDDNIESQYLLHDHIDKKHLFYDNTDSNQYFYDCNDSKHNLMDANIDSQPLLDANIDSQPLLDVNIDSKPLLDANNDSKHLLDVNINNEHHLDDKMNQNINVINSQNNINNDNKVTKGNSDSCQMGSDIKDVENEIDNAKNIVKEEGTKDEVVDSELPSGRNSTILKSLISFGAKKLKLDFLRGISGRKKRIKGCNSAEQVSCNVRYKKMNSARSTMF